MGNKEFECLQGMDPVLYSPEDLLGEDKRKEHAAGHRGEQQGNDEPQQPSSSWFSHWFGLSDARTSTSTADARAQSLHKPPFVSPTSSSCAWQLVCLQTRLVREHRLILPTVYSLVLVKSLSFQLSPLMAMQSSQQ